MAETSNSPASGGFSIASRYQELKQKRSPYEERAKACAKLTLPAAYPLNDEGGDSASTKIVTPYQGIGADGTTTLAAKLLLALMPPNTPCFRLRVPDQLQQQALQQAEGEEALTLMEQSLARIEQAVQEHIEASAVRPAMYEGFIQLIIAGNALLYCDKDGRVRLFRLPRYVVRRSPMGLPLEIITHEKVDVTSVPEAVRHLVEAEAEQGGTRPVEKVYDLYTYVRRLDEKWETWQECQGVKVPDSDGTFPLDACPFIPLRMYRNDEEDYGRSYVEQLLGDLKSLEALTQAILEGAASASKILFLVKPNGSTRLETIQNAPNGAVLTGDANDITVLQVGKTQDFRTALESAATIERRLSKAFLLTDSIRRNAERVTAEEIRALANELEAGFGGVYSLLSQEYQHPYISVTLHQLGKGNKIPQLPKSGVKLSIVAGLEALGRGNDRTKLQGFLQDIAPFVPPQMAGQYINIGNLLERAATANSVNPDGLLISEQTRQAQEQAAQEQAQQQKMQEAILPKGMDLAGKAIGGLPPEMLQGAMENMMNPETGLPDMLVGAANMQPQM